MDARALVPPHASSTSQRDGAWVNLPGATDLWFQGLLSFLRRVLAATLLVFSLCHTVSEISSGSDEALEAVWVTLLCIVCCAYTLIHGNVIKNDAAKTTEDVLRLFFAGFSPKSLMISYSWAHRVQPRKIRDLIGPACWLDTFDLYPGEIPSAACITAAARAKIRFVFMTPEYLKSITCQLEFEEICRHDPKSTLIFFENIPQEKVDDLQRMGFATVSLPPNNKFSPQFFLNKLSETGILEYAFQLHSPAINEDWQTTAQALVGVRTTRSVLFGLAPVFASVVSNIAVIAYSWEALHKTLSVLVKEVLVLSVLTILCSFVSLIDTIRFGMFKTSMDGIPCVDTDDLPDLGWLLVLLHATGMLTSPMTLVVDRQTALRHAKEFRLLEKHNVLKLIAQSNADVEMPTASVMCLDTNPEQKQGTPSDLVLYYTKGKFEEIRNELSASMQQTFIENGVPEFELVLVHTLRVCRQWQNKTFTIGSQGFKFRKQKTDLKPRWRLFWDNFHDLAYVAIVLISVCSILLTQLL